MKQSEKLKQIKRDVEMLNTGNLAHGKANIIGNLTWIIAEVEKEETQDIKKLCAISGDCKQRGENNECNTTVYCGYSKIKY